MLTDLRIICSKLKINYKKSKGNGFMPFCVLSEAKGMFISMLSMLKDKILKVVNKPVANIRSSQTLYEALFTTINLDLKYHDPIYKEQSDQLAKLIIESQLDDGGFDIGYNFSFGKNMGKKNHIESTTPEILSIYALIKYYDIYKDDSVKPAIVKGIEWVKKYSYKYRANYWVIPYAPCSYKEVHITNAVTFTVATLAYYMWVFEDDSVKDICDGMFLYMRDELILNGDRGHWNYFDKELMDDSYYIKVDNYHIAQQLFYHISIDKYYVNEDNKLIIKYVSNYLKEKLITSLAVPYIEVNGKCTNDIHTWGYCSLLSCSLFWEDMELTNNIKRFMFEKMWNNSYFYPVIKGNGDIVEKSYYPRSDAWLMHSFSEYLLFHDDADIKRALSAGIQMLRECNYRGYENHVLTIRKKAFNKFVIFVKKVLNK
ncbi:hypothetical protein GC102_25120 [Paenibacillus sp. LMG 31460]|uniref:Uncharacterized protein n=1 Tax=Paenibacillus germinis TaxID=2654979 RepID=A0ABX1Z9G4_9BACL|nr:hypothetical protein [Paenibacillus germinis]NOU89004.1 hypothetical protein [Paenibacillus germinis]